MQTRQSSSRSRRPNREATVDTHDASQPVEHSNPPANDEKPRPRRTQADRSAINLAAAQQFCEREWHLRVPRRHLEAIAVGGDGNAQESQDIKCGAWIGNQHTNVATLTPEPIEQLSAIGMPVDVPAVAPDASGFRAFTALGG